MFICDSKIISRTSIIRFFNIIYKTFLVSSKVILEILMGSKFVSTFYTRMETEMLKVTLYVRVQLLTGIGFVFTFFTFEIFK